MRRGGPSATLALFAAIAGTTIAHADPDAPSESEWKTDAQGRQLRVDFDLGSRVYLGSGVDSDGAFSFEGGILVRERDDVGVQWKLDHAFLTMRDTAAGVLDGTAYRGLFLRWSKDGALTIPTSPPARILLPFDLGFDVAFGSVRFDPTRGDAGFDALRVGVVRADLLFDFQRCRRLGNYLTLRTGVAYDVESRDDFRTLGTHVITPLSRVGLDYAHTWDSGREAFEVHGAVSHRTYVRGREQRWSTDADASLAYEIVLLALNDEPLSLRLEGAWRWSADADPIEANDVRGTVGVRFGITD